jgi:hypothetical protein
MLHMGTWNDEIYLDKNPTVGGLGLVPVLDTPASIPGFVKHIHCDGARFHVVSWGCCTSLLGRLEADIRCSEPKCIYNARIRPMIRKSGSATEDDVLALRELSNCGALAEIDPGILQGLIEKGYAKPDPLHPGRHQITTVGEQWFSRQPGSAG